MSPPTPTTTTSTEASEPEKSRAVKIRDSKWWQGAVLKADELTKLEPSLPHGPTHWVVATQTCNLYSENFDKIAKVEWIAAKEIQATDGDPLMRGGRNPRLLEVLAKSDKGEVWLQCDCQTRHWGDRAQLTRVPPQFWLKDSADEPADSQYKDIFVRWLARGYTRLELSDELGKALSSGKFDQAIENLVKAHGNSIYGIFMKLSPDDGSATNPEYIKPPCEIETILVVRHDKDLQSVKNKMSELFDEKIVPGDKGKGKISRGDALKVYGIRLKHNTVPASRWNVTDIEQSIRYNFLDHFSGTTEAGGD